MLKSYVLSHKSALLWLGAFFLLSTAAVGIGLDQALGRPQAYWLTGLFGLLFLTTAVACIGLFESRPTDMSWTVPLAITASMTIFGFFLSGQVDAAKDRAHAQADKERDHQNKVEDRMTDREHKKRDMQTQYLIDAYTKLSKAADLRGLNPEAVALIHDASNAIHLFGTKNQITALHLSINEVARTRQTDLDQILRLLREDLRVELMLDDLKAGTDEDEFLRLGVRFPREDLSEELKLESLKIGAAKDEALRMELLFKRAPNQDRSEKQEK